MTSQKALRIISTLLLLYCTFTLLMTLLGASVNGMPNSPLFISYVGLLMLAATVTFVASYRQLFKQRPTLVIAALCLIIISQCLGMFLLHQALNDPLNTDINKAINDAIPEGFENQIASMETSWMTLIKSIGFYCVLFALPLYTNLRKVTPPS